ncbi:uncharacterized protein LOC125560682 [Nematostella vectensis]|uniref:uncharacterized protein LOC125560682 n=1 Tax=Nematostella vectensis TaxID=45351 RepID=UPI0020773161|nr:uncharacterized protein LOC125560682 [Nematostella vectensis]
MSSLKPQEAPSVVSRKVLKVHRKNDIEVFLLNERMKTMDLRQSQRYLEIDLEKDSLNKTIDNIQAIKQNPGLSTERRKLLKSKGYTISVLAGDPEDEILLKKKSLQIHAGNWATLLLRPPNVDQNLEEECKNELAEMDVPRPQPIHSPRRNPADVVPKKRRPFSADFILGSRIQHKFRDIEPPVRQGSRRNFVQLSEDHLQKEFATSIAKSYAVKACNEGCIHNKRDCEKCPEPFDGHFMNAVIQNGATAKKAHLYSKNHKKVHTSLDNLGENGRKDRRMRSKSLMTAAELVFYKDGKSCSTRLDSCEEADPEKTLIAFSNSLPVASENKSDAKCDFDRSLNVVSSDEDDRGTVVQVGVGPDYHSLSMGLVNNENKIIATAGHATRETGHQACAPRSVENKSGLYSKSTDHLSSANVARNDGSRCKTTRPKSVDISSNRNLGMPKNAWTNEGERSSLIKQDVCNNNSFPLPGDIHGSRCNVKDGSKSSSSHDKCNRSQEADSTPEPHLDVTDCAAKEPLSTPKDPSNPAPGASKQGVHKKHGKHRKRIHKAHKVEPTSGLHSLFTAKCHTHEKTSPTHEPRSKDEVSYAYDARPEKSLSKGYTTMQMTVGGRQVKVCIPSFPSEVAKVRGPKKQSVRSLNNTV